MSLFSQTPLHHTLIPCPTRPTTLGADRHRGGTGLREEERKVVALIAMLRVFYTVQRYEYSNREQRSTIVQYLHITPTVNSVLCQLWSVRRPCNSACIVEGTVGTHICSTDVRQAARPREARENSTDRERDIRAVVDVDESPCTSLTPLAARKLLLQMQMRLESCTTAIATC